MHNYDGFAVDVTDQIIACAIEVHRHLGAGLLESVYESAMCLALKSAGMTFTRQAGVPRGRASNDSTRSLLPRC